MAAAFPSSDDSNSVIDIKAVITCSICKRQDSSQLVQLSCFHSCHKSCLVNALGRARPGSKFSCRECNTESVVPPGGVEGFEDELLQYKMAEIAKIFSNTPPPCKMCEAVEEENESSHYCITCDIYLCPSDTKRHQVSKDHVIITNAEIQTERYLPRLLTSKKVLCSIHSTATASRILEFFCDDCKVPVCQVCSITDHKPHKTVSMQDINKRMTEELNIKVRQIPHKIDQCEYVIGRLEKILKETDEESQKQIEKCDEWGENVKKAVDKIVEQNVKQIETSAQYQKEELTRFKERKIGQKNQFHGAKNYMDGFLLYGSESDVLQKHRIFTERLQRCLQQEVGIKMDVVAFDVQWKDFKEIEKDLEEKLYVETQFATVQLDTPQLKGCDQESKWETERLMHGVAVLGDEVLAVDGGIQVYGMTGQNKGTVDCHRLKHASDISFFNDQLFISDCDENKRDIIVMSRNGDIDRTISLPEKEHRFDRINSLMLAVDHINEDLYIVSRRTSTVYKCNKEQNQALPFITTGLNKPIHVCVSPQSEVIVSDTGNNTVNKYNSKGVLVWKYGRKGAGKEELNLPGGVCVDPWGHVFVCDYNNHRIQHLSSQGKFLTFIHIEEIIQGPFAITFKDNKIIVTSGKPVAQPGKIYVIKCHYS